MMRFVVDVDANITFAWPPVAVAVEMHLTRFFFCCKIVWK
jgi:hypothetical protein